MRRVTYEEITDQIPLGDQLSMTHRQAEFLKNGFWVEPKLLPNELIEHYTDVWWKHNGNLHRNEPPRYGGWNSPCPYLHVDQLKDLSLYRPVMDIIEELVGYEMMLNLQLTGFKSTQRDFHQDGYLNPSHVGDKYIAVWNALSDIHPNAGPFQFVRGSNHWPIINQEKVFKIMRKEQGISESDPLWPTKTESWVAQACIDEIARRGALIEDYLPNKGDVLFWSTRLVHRGSKPKRPELLRSALIAHYSSVERIGMEKKFVHINRQRNAHGYCFDSGIPLENDEKKV